MSSDLANPADNDDDLSVSARDPGEIGGGDTDLGKRTLAESTVEGIRWIGAARAFAEVLAFGASVVLARFVPPSEFGAAAAALGLIAAAEALVSQTMGTPVVRTADLTHRMARTAVLLALSSGVLVAAALVAVAFTVVAPLLGDRTAELVALGTPAILVVGIGTVGRALLLRQLVFRTLGLIEVGALIAGAGTAVVLATVFALDGEALVLGFVASNSAAALVAFAFAPRVWPGWGGRRVAHELLAFGLPSGGSSVLAVAFKSIDYLVLAARLPAAAVGYYWRAFTLGVEYQQKFGLVMQRVAFPVFSRAESVVELRRLRLRAMSTYATAVFPLLATLVAVAPVAVPWVFGADWQPAVVPTQILSGAGMITALIVGTPAFVFALGRPKPVLAYNVIAVIGLALVAYLSAPLGVSGVAASVLGFYGVLLALNHVWLLHAIGGIPASDLVHEPAAPFIACLPLVAVDVALVELGQRGDAPDFLILLLTCPVGLGVYALALRVVFPGTWGVHRKTFLRVLGVQRRSTTTATATDEVASPLQ